MQLQKIIRLLLDANKKQLAAMSLISLAEVSFSIPVICGPAICIHKYIESSRKIIEYTVTTQPRCVHASSQDASAPLHVLGKRYIRLSYKDDAQKTIKMHYLKNGTESVTSSVRN